MSVLSFAERSELVGDSWRWSKTSGYETASLDEREVSFSLFIAIFGGGPKGEGE